jgi:peptidyl-tRNA hydrolase, PTH1 family
MDAEPSSSNEDSSSRSVFVVAGLGNPGVKYEATPHNVGFWVLDELANRHLIRITKNESGTLTGSGKIRNRDAILVKPQTFMNNSGVGIGAVLKYRNLSPESLVVVHDELDLPWSALRIRTTGSAAGHNGVKSIIAALKTNVFTRVRVGIRPDHPVNDAAGYVLAPLEREMRAEMGELVSYTADAIETILAEGATKAMAKFNRRARGSKEEDE